MTHSTSYLKATSPHTLACPTILRLHVPPTNLLPLHFLVHVARQITENGTVIPDGPKIARKARFVIQDALENGTFPSSIEMALTKLVSNFNYLWGWTRFQDKQLEVTVGLLNEMMAVLKGMLSLPSPWSCLRPRLLIVVVPTLLVHKLTNVLG